MAIKWPWRKRPSDDLAALLADSRNVETLLGVKAIAMPTPETVKSDAGKLVSYSKSTDYKIFADEAWSRILSHLDVMMDEKASKERVDYHRGACKEALDLLRLSFQARELLRSDVEREQSVTTGR